MCALNIHQIETHTRSVAYAKSSNESDDSFSNTRSMLISSWLEPMSTRHVVRRKVKNIHTDTFVPRKNENLF